MHMALKNMPRLRLADLLKRRKMTLLQFINESGVQTYEGLVNRCDRIGVQPPAKDEYMILKPEIVSSPQDGVVILEPEPIPEDTFSYVNDMSLLSDAQLIADETLPEDSPKKKRKKKENYSE
jgi:hypothetical protein